jgi:hypothetical protein
LFPGSREEAARIAQEYQGASGIAAYVYASEAFWWPAFEPALGLAALAALNQLTIQSPAT